MARKKKGSSRVVFVHDARTCNMSSKGGRMARNRTTTVDSPLDSDHEDRRPDSNADDDDIQNRTTDDEKPSSIKARSRSRLRRELDSLHKEMEIVQYGFNEKTGHARRKVPKRQAKSRTRKRQMLEAQDAEMRAERESSTQVSRKRLRGAMVAAEDEVVKGSLVFGMHQKDRAQDEEKSAKEDMKLGTNIEFDDAEADDEEEISAEEGSAYDGSGMENDGEHGSDVEEDDEAGDKDNGDGVEESERASSAARKTKSKRKGIGRRKGRKSGNRPVKKKMFRLRNFKSFKLAQRHGDALGYHARGLPKLAIQKLKEVAKEAPSAPQVYSSLGMVYEDMLRDSQKKGAVRDVDNDRTEEANSEAGGDGAESSVVPDPLLAEQLELGRKAYGSYHVAAILCKKDYALWVRAADSAAEIAQLHSAVMLLPFIDSDLLEYHRSEKERWLSEAKNDYQAADNLHPPGIEIPSRLAGFLIELGHLSEALTLLTDMKNRTSPNTPSEFDSSYRAWMFYADLLARIGYECNKWNEGDRSNCNYMFRRWLRKLSKTFDWQERRLQALGKALEAAAGSKSCKLLMEWMEKRAHATSFVDSTSGEAGSKPNNILGDTPAFSSEEFEREKELLLERNRVELAAFEKTSGEMDLTGSVAMTARKRSREALVAKQKADLVELVGSFHHSSGEPRSSTPTSETRQAQMGRVTLIFPISASCQTVCRIASELMRQLISLGLFAGGRLVGDATSDYLKERAGAVDKRITARQKFRESQVKPSSLFALHREAYDTVDRSSEGEDSDSLLSDDDKLGQPESANVVNSLRRGVLPPELRVLYGLCLAGEGGKQFLALKCLRAIDGLEQEPVEWLNEELVDTSVVADSSWLALQTTMTEPLGRTAAYALTADLLKNNRLKIQGAKLSPLFTACVEKLIMNGVVDKVLEGPSSHPLVQQRRLQVLDVLLMSARFQTLAAEQAVQSTGTQNEEAGRNTIALLFDNLSRYLSLLWRPADGTISSLCVEILSLMATSLGLLHSFQATQPTGFLEELVASMRKPVSLICDSSLGGSLVSLTQLQSTPFSDSWLSDELRKVSLRAYNCAVATNCSHFSGWENEEFTKDLFRNVGTPYYFGITMSGGRVAGYMASTHTSSLSKQWGILRGLLPDSISFDFPGRLAMFSSSSEYEELRRRRHLASASQKISLFGEEDCLTILLSFSHGCLELAQRTANSKLQAHLVETALSIVLPISQFAVNDILWSSSIGRAALSRPGLEQWRPLSSKRREESNENTTHAPRRRKTQPIVAQGDEDLYGWFAFENEQTPLSNVIKIPPYAILAEWKSGSCEPVSAAPDERAREAMAQLNRSMRNLRTCYSHQAAERGSLLVAVSLLRLAETTGCQNPFLCLQQAGLFASRGTKGGASEDFFKQPLPKMESCSPSEALAILGRSECLQAVYFYPEAAFLCSYVAKACSIRRSSLDHTEWNSQWTVISLLTYNQSVFLRAAASSIVKEHGRKEDTTGTWETLVVDELRRAKSDGLSWQANLKLAATSSVRTSGTNIDVREAAAHPGLSGRNQEVPSRIADDDQAVTFPAGTKDDRDRGLDFRSEATVKEFGKDDGQQKIVAV